MAADVRNTSSSIRSQKNEYDPYTLPDYDTNFIHDDELEEFARALAAPETEPVIALNDWRPIHQKVKRSRLRRKFSMRNKDETREGFVYTLLRFPLLFLVFGWIVCLFIAYNITRLYIHAYEHLFSWTGRRESIRRQLQQADSYQSWCKEAQRLDEYLGNEDWKRNDAYAYYNHQTVKQVMLQLGELKRRIASESHKGSNGVANSKSNAINDLKALL